MAHDRPALPSSDDAAARTPDLSAGPRRHEVDVERRRMHPGEPRRVVAADRPTPRDDRRGAHAYARSDRCR